jgi:sugar/nucleoside kinase (ribokinase family)
VDGKTFRWSGEYSWDLNTRETRSVALNVFADFQPSLPESYRQTEFALLANIAPSLQSHVLDQMERPRFVVADTMDLWIETTRGDLDALLPRADLLILNDSEAREMTKETSLIKAGRTIREMGPRYVAIKKGEHGALLFGDDEFFSCGAYPLEDIHDPTGAGGHFRRRGGRFFGCPRERRSNVWRSSPGNHLRQRAGQLLRRGFQSGAPAQVEQR